MGSPLESPGHCSHLGGRNRVIEPVHQPRPARHLCPLPESGLPQKKILGTELKVPQVQPEEGPAPFFKYSPPQRRLGSGEGKEAKLPLLDFDLEALPELGPEVDHFLQESAGSSEEETGIGPLQNPWWKNTRGG